MEFYVPLGVRGLLLRIGTFVIGILGGMAYRQAARRRAHPAQSSPLAWPLAENLVTE